MMILLFQIDHFGQSPKQSPHRRQGDSHEYQAKNGNAPDLSFRFPK